MMSLEHTLVTKSITSTTMNIMFSMYKTIIEVNGLRLRAKVVCNPCLIQKTILNLTFSTNIRQSHGTSNEWTRLSNQYNYKLTVILHMPN